MSLRILGLPVSAVCLILVLLCYSLNIHAKSIRVAVLQHGTVHWELDVIQHHGLLENQGIELDIVKVSSTNAVNVMLQAGHVDIIVGDWIWVSRQRNSGRMYTSFPYSLAEGSLMVNPKAEIKTVEDIAKKKLGVAGSEVNKNWLITRAYSIRKYGQDISGLARVSFAAPPLLNQLMLKGDFDAVLNYWHYSAMLETAGMNSLITIDDMLAELSISRSVPLLVWIFREEWVDTNDQLLKAFLDASFTAKQILANSEQEWVRLKNLTRVNDDNVLANLRRIYRGGIPKKFAKDEINAASALFKLMGELGGRDLVGDEMLLSPGTFYMGYNLEHAQTR